MGTVECWLVLHRDRRWNTSCWVI